jgi:hypothetical protein
MYEKLYASTELPFVAGLPMFTRDSCGSVLIAEFPATFG